LTFIVSYVGGVCVIVGGGGGGGGEGAEGRIPPHRPIKAVVNRIKDSKQFYIEAKYNGSSTG